MKQIHRRTLACTLLASLYLCTAAVQAAGAPPVIHNGPSLVEVGPSGINVNSGSHHFKVGSSGINISGGGGHVVIGNSGIRITDNSNSIVIAREHHQCPDNQQIVAIGHDAQLPAGETACAVVTIMGSSEVDGNLTNSAVAILGDTRVNGNVANNVVTIFGNGRINGTVGGNAVSIFGDLKLGPQAIVQGQAVNLFGSLARSPSAVIQGGTVKLMPGFAQLAHPLQAWSAHCLLLGRLLAPRGDVLWAWGVALGILVLYLLLAALFRDSLRHCIRTLENHPGPSILTALAMVLGTPLITFVLMIALAATVIGIVFIPLLWIAVLCAEIFGRVIAIGWLGGRVLRGARGGAGEPVLQVLIGGVIVLALYMVPVLGFIVFSVVGLIGFGALIYTLLLALRSTRGAAPQPQPATPSGPADGGTAAPADETASVSAEPGPAGDTGASGGDSAAPAGASIAEPAPFELTALPRAGFWIRMAALLIDVVLVGFALSLIGHNGADGTLIALAIYGALMWKLRGTTVGGIICNLRVIRIDGHPLSWETSILRALGCFLSLVAVGLGFFWIAFDAERQGWHDKIAGTVVVLMPKTRGLV